MRSVRVKGIVLFLAVAILAVEGYFLYKYYDQYYDGSTASGATNISSSRGESTDTGAKTGAKDSAQTTLEETTVEEAPPKKSDGNEVVFVHRSTSKNIVNNSTYIDHPSTNKNPKAILLVTQIWEAGSDGTNVHPIGVWYDSNRGGKWAIFNQDLAPMPEDLTFNIVIPKSSAEVAVHRASPENTVDNTTYLDHPLANDNPKAVLSVTPNWNPGGIGGVYDDHLVGVRYDTNEKRWAILNQDLAQMPRSAAFNVFFSDSVGSAS
ncbi:hypothetical protein BH24ACT22_BH24ACT22_14220 [soil metagenome]